MTLLETISGPGDLKDLAADQLPGLAREIRELLIDWAGRPVVATTSGHLGPNLGVVELTIALHRVFDSPRDKIVFDIGHQAYVHKLLTGRQGASARYGSGADHLAAVRMSPRYEDVLEYIRTTLSRTPVVGPPLYGVLHGVKKGLKDVLAPQVLFEDLGLKYLGPLDGHDELVAIGARRPDVVAITAAMVHPTGLAPFAEAYPDRVYDVGIAEPHALTSAAGLAMGGLDPVVVLYSTFLSRAFDQLLLDVALHRLPVTIARRGTRPGSWSC